MASSEISENYLRLYLRKSNEYPTEVSSANASLNCSTPSYDSVLKRLKCAFAKWCRADEQRELVSEDRPETDDEPLEASSVAPLVMASSTYGSSASGSASAECDDVDATEVGDGDKEHSDAPSRTGCGLKRLSNSTSDPTNPPKVLKP